MGLLNSLVGWLPRQVARYVKVEWRWILVVAGILLAVVVVWLYLGWIFDSYKWLWQNTTGRPYTEIMRDRLWLLIVPAIVIMAAVMWLLRRSLARQLRRISQANLRAVLLAQTTLWMLVVLVLGLGLGIVIGHVVW